MRIGFDAKRAFNNNSGLGNYSRNTIRLLTDHYPENEYLLYTPEIKISLDFDLPPGSSVRQPGINLGRYFRSWWRSVSLGSELARDGVELYHGLSHDLPVRMGTSSVRTVVTVHDMIPYRRPELFSTANSMIYRKKITHSCNIADKIIAISVQTKNDMEEILNIDPARIEVIYQGCDPAYYIKADAEARNRVKLKYDLPSEYILSVGTLEPRKNLPGIIRAMRLGGLDCGLVVAGKKTPYLKTILGAIDAAGLKNVRFLENVPVADLAAIYQSAEVFVYPSFYEGFGIPILEALSSGTPVITSKGGCFNETAGNDSMFVDPHDNEELAAALKTVLTDSSVRKKMITGGLDHALSFRHDRIAENLMTVYKSALKI
ncbi:MAG: glycosyltransferase family 4 protein [Bacteroidales bacterium]